MTCPLCQHPMREAFRHAVLGHHEAVYDQCTECGFLHARSPDWLEEAYATSYTANDSGIVSRCLQNRLKTEVVLHGLFGESGSYVDIGGGIGLFTRMMRDIGFDFRTCDQYAEPILARGFEATDDLPATALTAFEVIEHTLDPLAFLRDNLRQHGCRTILLSTTTFEGQPPSEDWPYYGFGHGQHVSFLTPRAIDAVANALGLAHYPILRDLHLLTDRSVSWRLRQVFRYRLLFLLEVARVRFLRRRRSLTQEDSK